MGVKAWYSTVRRVCFLLILISILATHNDSYARIFFSFEASFSNKKSCGRRERRERAGEIARWEHLGRTGPS